MTSRGRTASRKVSAYLGEYSHLGDTGRAYAIGFGAILIIAIPFLLLDLAVLLLTGKDLGWFPAEPLDSGAAAAVADGTPESAEQILALMEPLKQPALHVIAATDSGVISKIGGLPAAPAPFVWPDWQGRPLAFLAQLDLAEMGEHAVPDLPESGLLYFFYDAEQSTWGFDPSDRGSWRVLFFPAGEELTSIDAPPTLVRHGLFAEKRVTFRRIASYPSTDRLPIGPNNISMDDWDEVDVRRGAAFGDLPRHQVGGLPNPVQGDSMELECQLAFHGINCGDGTAFSDPRAERLKPGSADWRLLLQLDTDDDIDMMWGDCGTLYFWIRADDLRKCEFSAVWMILQCC